MADVLIDDSSLNAIANALRQKNGLVRTYKPREMPPAIRALKEFVPSTRGYSIRIIQSEHQTITVKVYRDNSSQTYDRSFTVSEPLWKFEATITPDAGYIAGTLNYNGTFSIDRDYVIQAQPATYKVENVTTLYMNGNVHAPNISAGHYYYMYSDYNCTQQVTKSSIYGIVNVIDRSNGYPYRGEGIFGGQYDVTGLVNAIEIRQNINVSEKRSLKHCFGNLPYLKKVDLTSWNPVNVTNLEGFSENSPIQYFGDISHWNMPELINAEYMFEDNNKLESIDLHDWQCPKLETTERMFNGCDKLRFVDISGLSTEVNETSNFVSSNQMFKDCLSLQYIIMDRPEVMFASSGTLFANPNNNVKYLVPREYVNQYKSHSNWSSRASQIEAIEDYTIDRYGGQVFVTRDI